MDGFQRLTRLTTVLDTSIATMGAFAVLHTAFTVTDVDVRHIQSPGSNATVQSVISSRLSAFVVAFFAFNIVSRWWFRSVIIFQDASDTTPLVVFLAIMFLITLALFVLSTFVLFPFGKTLEACMFLEGCLVLAATAFTALTVAVVRQFRRDLVLAYALDSVAVIVSSIAALLASAVLRSAGQSEAAAGASYFLLGLLALVCHVLACMYAVQSGVAMKLSSKSGNSVMSYVVYRLSIQCPRARLETFVSTVCGISAASVLLFVDMPTMISSPSGVKSWFSSATGAILVFPQAVFAIGGLWWLHALVTKSCTVVTGTIRALTIQFCFFVALLPFGFMLSARLQHSGGGVTSSATAFIGVVFAAASACVIGVHLAANGRQHISCQAGSRLIAAPVLGAVDAIAGIAGISPFVVSSLLPVVVLGLLMFEDEAAKARGAVASPTAEDFSVELLQFQHRSGVGVGAERVARGLPADVGLASRPLPPVAEGKLSPSYQVADRWSHDDNL